MSQKQNKQVKNLNDRQEIQEMMLVNVYLALLPFRKQMFVKEYLRNPNGTEAAIGAGLSKRTAASQASRMLKDVNVARAIAEGRRIRSENLDIDAFWVVERLKEVAARSMQAEPVMEFDPVEKKMVETGEYKFDSTGANRALELMGKHIGMFESKEKNTNGIAIQINISQNDAKL